MKLIANKTLKLEGEALIPASKSHTIRAIIIASFADGVSELKNPLISEDTKAIINACSALGAQIEQKSESLIINGCGTNPIQPEKRMDMLNSGTSANLMLGILAAFGLDAEITGDYSLKSRPVSDLTNALIKLGSNIEFLEKDGCPPLRISGKIHGSQITLDADKSSQYVSSLLLACPLLEQNTGKLWCGFSHLGSFN